MHVRFRFADVADRQILPGRGHELHDSDRADPAACTLIEARLLVALRRDQQRIEIVRLPDFSKRPITSRSFLISGSVAAFRTYFVFAR